MEISLKSYETIEPGVYPASIVEVKPEAGQYGDQLRVKFLLEDEANTALSAWTSTSFSPKSKLYALARAAFGGREFDPGFTLDTDRLIGRRLRVMVTVKPRTDGAGDFNRITEFYPLQPPKAAMAPTAQTAVRPATNGSQRPTVALPEEPADLFPEDAPARLLSDADDETAPF